MSNEQTNMLYLNMSSFTESTREPTSNDNWDRGDSHTSWEFLSVTKESKNWEFDSFWTKEFKKVGDIIFVVIAVYSSGDSFGHDSGKFATVLDSFDNYQDADAYKSIMQKDNSSNVPWSGYFDSLDYITIEEFTVGE